MKSTPTNDERTPPRIIALGGGKGGVGKSVLSANIAVALAEFGNDVVLVDADLGMANTHTLFSIERPGKGLGAVLDHDVQSLEDAWIETGIANLRLIPGTSASPGTANINHGQKQKLLRQIRSLKADIVLIDCGAGAAFNTLDFFALATNRVVVVTPQITSIQNAYGFFKSAVHRILVQAAGDRERKEVVKRALDQARGMARVPEVVARLSEEDAELGAALQSQLDHFGASVIGNYIYAPKEEAIIQTMGRLCRDFLGIQAPTLGVIPASKHMHASVNARVPLLKRVGSEPLAHMVRRVAAVLAEQNVQHAQDARIFLPSGAPPPPAAAAEVQQQAVVA